MTTKTILVTGASNGIGAAVARFAGERGWNVVVNYHRDEASAELVAQAVESTGGQAVIIPADVSNPNDIKRLFSESIKHFKHVDYLVNNAGISYRSAVIERVDLQKLNLLIQTNLIGTVLACNEAAIAMKDRGGAIVNVSSTTASNGGKTGRAYYAATKAAVDIFTQGFAREVAQYNIRANSVRPGPTQTRITQSQWSDPDKLKALASSIPMGRIGQPDEIAKAVIWLLSEQASYVTGSILTIDGGGMVIPDTNFG